MAPPAVARLEAQLTATRAALAESELERAALAQSLERLRDGTDPSLQTRLDAASAECALHVERAAAAAAREAGLERELRAAREAIKRLESRVAALRAKPWSLPRGQPQQPAGRVSQHDDAPRRATLQPAQVSPAAPPPPPWLDGQSPPPPSVPPPLPPPVTYAGGAAAHIEREARLRRALESAQRRATVAESRLLHTTSALRDAEARTERAEAGANASARKLRKATAARDEAAEAAGESARVEADARRVGDEWRAAARAAQEGEAEARASLAAERDARGRLTDALTDALSRLEAQHAEMAEIRSEMRRRSPPRSRSPPPPRAGARDGGCWTQLDDLELSWESEGPGARHNAELGRLGGGLACAAQCAGDIAKRRGGPGAAGPASSRADAASLSAADGSPLRSPRRRGRVSGVRHAWRY